MSSSTRTRRLPWVLPEYCEGCTSCLAVCPKGLISMRPDADGFVPWIDDPDACTGCGKCADICGLGGIAMTEFVEEARERLLARNRARQNP